MPFRILRVLTPLLLSAVYLFLLTYQEERVAITDDARFYFDAGQSYATWIERVWDNGDLFDKQLIDRYWRKNHEHPPLAKLIMAAGYLVHRSFDVMERHVSFRIGISILAALLLLFIFDFVRRTVSFRAAVFAALFFICMPRVFFHARVATLDFTVGALSFIFVYTYWRGLHSPRWAWLTGPVFGLALASKLNAPFMALPVLLHYLFISRHRLRHRPIQTIFAPQFISMLLFSLPIFFILWPWLWFDTIDRITEYMLFHLDHYGIFMYYLGEIFADPAPPWHAPLVMTLVTIPAATLFCIVVAPFVTPLRHELRSSAPLLLTALSALVSIGVLMVMPAPFYSGVKLFQPLFPFLAVIAGTSLYHLLKNIRILPPGWHYAPALLLFISPLLDMKDLRHDHLSYYSELIGGTKGALEYKLERHYYDLFYYDLTLFFNKSLSRRSRVHVVPNGKEYNHTSRILRRGNMLTDHFHPSGMKNADWLVLTHEYRWAHYPELLMTNRFRRPVFILRRQGVPLLSVYRVTDSSNMTNHMKKQTTRDDKN